MINTILRLLKKGEFKAYKMDASGQGPEDRRKDQESLFDQGYTWGKHVYEDKYATMVHLFESREVVYGYHVYPHNKTFFALDNKYMWEHYSPTGDII